MMRGPFFNLVMIVCSLGCTRPSNHHDHSPGFLCPGEGHGPCPFEWHDPRWQLLEEDEKNKRLELEYLDEIQSAEENNDSDAFKFYLQEYMNVPRLEVPEDLKDDPRYFQGGRDIKY